MAISIDYRVGISGCHDLMVELLRAALFIGRIGLFSGSWLGVFRLGSRAARCQKRQGEYAE